MPVIYHHVQFPYTDVDKFKKRAHRFILFGLVPSIVTALSPLIDTLAYFVAGLPFIFVYILYRMRK